MAISSKDIETLWGRYQSEGVSKGVSVSQYFEANGIQKLNCFYSETEVFDDNGSIEHILPESNELSLNIGNLIWLELNINNKAKDNSYLTKKEYYARSKYDWVQNFVKYHEDWNENKITDRAKQLARIYYEKIFDRIIE